MARTGRLWVERTIIAKTVFSRHKATTAREASQRTRAQVRVELSSAGANSAPRARSATTSARYQSEGAMYRRRLAARNCWGTHAQCRSRLCGHPRKALGHNDRTSRDRRWTEAGAPLALVSTAQQCVHDHANVGVPSEAIHDPGVGVCALRTHRDARHPAAGPDEWAGMTAARSRVAPAGITTHTTAGGSTWARDAPWPRCARL